MNSRTAIFSMAVLGMLGVPAFAIAQGTGNSAGTPLDKQFSNVTINAGAPAHSGNVPASAGKTLSSIPLKTEMRSPYMVIPDLRANAPVSMTTGMHANARAGNAPSREANTRPGRATNGQVKTLDSVTLSAHNSVSGTPVSQNSVKSIQSFGGSGQVSGQGFGTLSTPEPGSVALIVGSLIGGTCVLRRRKK